MPLIPIQSPYFDTEHGLQTWIHTVLVRTNTKKRVKKNRKKGEKSCQEYQWYINYWPPCPGFGPKNGQKGLKTTYSKNHGGHINYLPTCFNKKKTFDTRDSRVVPHRSTDRAQWSLTSQFGWDAVYPPWCDRMMRCMIL